MIKLSILTMTTPRRRNNCVQCLLDDLEKQAAPYPDVEILALYDNKKRSVGAKRNAILQMAQGEYVVSIDDDDSVASTYVDDIMACLSANPGIDCVVFDCITSIHHDNKVVEKHYSKYSKNYEYSITPVVDRDGFKQWRGLPAHTMVYRTEIAKRHTFPEMNCGEDVGWVRKVAKDVRAEARIDKVLYFYAFNPLSSETRG